MNTKMQPSVTKKKTPSLLSLRKRICPVCKHIDTLSYQRLSNKDRLDKIRRVKCFVCETKNIPIKPEERHCLSCKVKFLTFKEDKIFCSSKCRVRWFRKENK